MLPTGKQWRISKMRQTSLISYHELLGKTKELTLIYTRILRCVGITPRTDREIASLLGFSDPNHIRPRRNELVKKGLIAKIGMRKCEISGKLAILWGLRLK